LWRAVQRVTGIVGQFLTAISGGCGTVQNRNAVTENHNLLPTGSPREVVIDVRKFAGVSGNIECAPKYELEFHCGQAPGAVAEPDVARYRV
jgi:hypothetical protein